MTHISLDERLSIWRLDHAASDESAGKTIQISLYKGADPGHLKSTRLLGWQKWGWTALKVVGIATAIIASSAGFAFGMVLGIIHPLAGLFVCTLSIVSGIAFGQFVAKSANAGKARTETAIKVHHLLSEEFREFVDTNLSDVKLKDAQSLYDDQLHKMFLEWNQAKPVEETF